MFSTNRISNGLFEVLWDGKPTIYTIFNGYLGVSGDNSRNIYVISINNKNSQFRGTLQGAKYTCQLWIEDAVKAGKNIYATEVAA